MVILRCRHPTAQFARSTGEHNASVITRRANLFLKLQNFVLQLIESSLKIVKLLLFSLESFFCLFGVRTNNMDRRIWFDLHGIRSGLISGRTSPAVNHDDSLKERRASRFWLLYQTRCVGQRLRSVSGREP